MHRIVGIELEYVQAEEAKMRIHRLLLILSLSTILLNCAQTPESNKSIRSMTFNIRLNVASDSLNAWPHRKQMAASMVQFYQADIVGVQEALIDQVHDLEARLPEYEWFGIGRDDGKEQGEFMAIFYLKDRFTILEDSTFWLSETPEVPGKGWDAACNRTVTWGKFLDKETNRTFYFFNTHFDHYGELARIESAKLILRNIRAIAGNADVVLTGDFNSTPDSDPYIALTSITKAANSVNLLDSKSITQDPHHGPNGTFNGFDLSTLNSRAREIDYIFVTKGIGVKKHATLADTFDGFFPSDHMPVFAEIIIP